MTASFSAAASPTGPAGIPKAHRNSPLVSYALRGLDRCWLPEHGRWSHIYHLDGRDPPNESVPHSDVFYTLNVLLGLSRVASSMRTRSISAPTIKSSASRSARR